MKLSESVSSDPLIRKLRNLQRFDHLKKMNVQKKKTGKLSSIAASESDDDSSSSSSSSDLQESDDSQDSSLS